MDKLAAIQTLVDIVDEGSLTAAAEKQDRSVAAIGRTLAALEQHLGARLINRTTRRMSLTAEGRGYLEHCRRILIELREADLSVAQRQRGPEGEIRITTPDLFGQLHVIPLLTSFIASYPKVRLEVLLLDRVIDLIDEGIDLAVRIGEVTDSSLLSVPIGHMRRVVCASPDLLRRHGIPKHPEALTDVPCVLCEGKLKRNQWKFVDRGRQFTVAVNGRFECNRAMAAVQACADGVGFGYLLHYQVEPFLRERKLAIVLREYEPESLPVSVTYPETSLVSARLRKLVTWLTDALREQVAHLK